MSGNKNIEISQVYSSHFVQGEETGLKYFFDKYYGSLCLYAERLCGDEGFAAEMASEAFFQTWRQREQFTSASSIRAYLYTVVKNGCGKFLLKRNRETQTSNLFTEEPERTVQEAIIFSETVAQLHQLITTLPNQCGAVLKSLYVEGKSVSETAKEMKLAISTVKSHKRNGVDMLRRKSRLFILFSLFIHVCLISARLTIPIL